MPIEYQNVDAMSYEERAAYIREIEQGKSFVAKRLTNLWNYCVWKQRATRLREQGKIARALSVEEELDKMFSKLPKEQRW